MANLRVGNVVEDSRFAGPQNRILKVAIGLKQSGIDTVVFLPGNSSEFVKRLRDAKIEIVVSPITPPQKKIGKLIVYLIRFPYEIIWLTKKFKNESIDIVHCSGGAWQVKAAIAGRLSKIPSIWHLNDTLTPKIIKIVFSFLCKRTSSAVIVAGVRVKKYYRKELNGVHNIKIIPAPVDTLNFTNDIQCTLESEVVRLISVGHINYLKGFDYLLKVFNQLNQDSDIQFQLTIVGSVFDSQAAYFSELQFYIERHKIENVNFIFDAKDVKSILREQDIYICSSIAEASPTSVWEAMSMSLPIVATDVGDVSKHVYNGKNGFVVDVGDIPNMVKRIEFLAREAEQRQKYGNFSRKIAVDRFDTSIVVQKHLDIYEEVFKSKNNSK